MEHKPSFFIMMLKGINVVRLIIVNILFFTFLFVGLALMASLSEKDDGKHTITYGTILEIAPVGTIVEREDEYEWMEAMFSERRVSSRLSQIILAIKEATVDEKIEALYLDFSYLRSFSSAHLDELEDALITFKQSGKPIWAYSTSYSIKDYYLASFADRIGLDPMGELDLEGFSYESLYFKGMEEKFGFSFQTFHAGNSKGGVETFSRKDMSPQVKENIGSMLVDMWKTYKNKVSHNIGKSETELEIFAKKPYELLAKYGGNDALMAKGEGFVSEMAERGKFKDAMLESLSQKEGDSLEFASYLDYIKNINIKEKNNKIGIIYLNGSITNTKKNGMSNNVAVASNIAHLFEKACKDDSIKAIVLRVNSGGGEVFASELMRRSLVKAKESGKPVVVSMGSVAASGAYWISSHASYIFATHYTITGSIGVFAVLPNFHAFLRDRLGITTDGVNVLQREKTHLEPLSEEEQQKMTLSIDATYDNFIKTVCLGRRMSEDVVLPIAEGKIYSGEQAKKLGLIDEIGTFEEAIQKAAELSNIEDFSVIEVREPLSPINQAMKTLLENDASFNLDELKSWMEFAYLQDENGIYAYTPCRLK